MKQVLRFNKVIKRIVFTGDLILLNGTFLSLYTLIGEQIFADPFIHSLPQVLVLLNLCYLVSNMSSGIILHRPCSTSRANRMACLTQQCGTRLVFFLRAHLWKLRHPFRPLFLTVLHCVHSAVGLLPVIVPQDPEVLSQAWRQLPQHHSGGKQ